LDKKNGFTISTKKLLVELLLFGLKSRLKIAKQIADK